MNYDDWKTRTPESEYGELITRDVDIIVTYEGGMEELMEINKSVSGFLTNFDYDINENEDAEEGVLELTIWGMLEGIPLDDVDLRYYYESNFPKHKELLISVELD